MLYSVSIGTEDWLISDIFMETKVVHGHPE